MTNISYNKDGGGGPWGQMFWNSKFFGFCVKGQYAYCMKHLQRGLEQHIIKDNISVAKMCEYSQILTRNGIYKGYSLMLVPMSLLQT